MRHGGAVPAARGRGSTIVSMNTVIVGTGPVSFADVVAVARRRRRRGAVAGRPRRRSPPAARSSTRSPATRRRITASRPGSGPWRPGTSRPELRAQLQRSLVRSHAAGSGPEVEAEVVRAMMLLRLSTLATGRTGVRLEVARAYAAMLSAGITPVVREYGSLGCSGDLAPLAHCALAAMGEGTVRVSGGLGGADGNGAAPGPLVPAALRGGGHRAARPGREGGPRADQRHRRDARHAGARRGRPARAAARPRTSPPRCASRRCSAPTRRSTPGCRRCARTRGRRRPPPTCGRCWPGSAVVASHRGPGRHPGPGRVLAALRAAGARRGPRHARARGGGRGHRARQRHRQPGGHRGRPRGVQRQLPRRAGRVRAGLPGDRRRRRRLDRRAAHRPDARRRPLARAAAVPGRRPRRRLRAHDRPVHAGRHRVRAEAARRPGQRRLDPVVGHAGGPRVDGLVGGPQAAPRHRRPDPGAGDRAAHRRPRRWTCAPAGPGAGDRRGRRRRCAPTAAPRSPGPDRFLAPEIEAAVGYVASGAAVRAAETTAGPLG